MKNGIDFQDAAAKGDLIAIEEMKPQFIENLDVLGNALKQTAIHGQFEIAKALIDLKLSNMHIDFTLEQASRRGYKNIVILLLEKKEISSYAASHAYTAATEAGYHEIAELVAPKIASWDMDRIREMQRATNAISQNTTNNEIVSKKAYKKM